MTGCQGPFEGRLRCWDQCALLAGTQVAPDIQCGKDPGGVALVPFERAAGEETAEIVEHQVAAEGEFHADDLETEGRSTEAGEVLAGEVLETARGQVAPAKRGYQTIGRFWSSGWSR